MAEQMVVSEKMLEALRGTGPWVKFIAILWFVFSGLMVLAGLFMLGMGPFIAKAGGMPAAFGAAFGAFYIVLAVFIMLIPGLYLLRYGQAISQIPNSGQPAVESALLNQKKYWKYMGVMLIVFLVLYAVMFFGAIVFGVVAGLSQHT